MINYETLTHIAQLNSPAPEEAIQAAQDALGFPFPSTYIALLRYSNGLTAHWDISSFTLYGVDDVAERNSTYEVAVYAPTLLMIGDDGGGQAILIDRAIDDPPVYIVGMGSMVLEDADLLAPHFTIWIMRGLNLSPVE